MGMWLQLLASLVGIGVMALPAVVEVPELVNNGLRILGPIAVATGGIAAAEVTRGVRWANVPVGIGIAAVTTVGGASLMAIGLAALSGAALVGLAFTGSQTSGRYGGGWRSLLD
jgi:hypothetical protein